MLQPSSVRFPISIPSFSSLPFYFSLGSFIPISMSTYKFHAQHFIIFNSGSSSGKMTWRYGHSTPCRHLISEISPHFQSMKEERVGNRGRKREILEHAQSWQLMFASWARSRSFWRVASYFRGLILDDKTEWAES